MNFHWIDWLVVSSIVVFMIWIGYYSKRYIHGVTDFLAANRLAGKYLLTVSSGMTGTIGMIAAWQMLFNAGLSTQWWAMMSIPLGLVISLSGFIIYRFRETRALTLAQFFEVRYSRRFRFFAGGLCWLSGLLNYGVFPAVTGRLIMTFLSLPETFSCLGMQISTFPTIMTAYLSIAVFIACSGGQISIMISDFFQEFVCKVILIAIVCYLLYHYSWDNIVAGLQNAPEGKSMINPFSTGKIESFNIWYFLIGVFGGIYNAKSWQGTSGYNAAAKTPHDARMAGILAGWRYMAYSLCLILPPIIAYSVFHNDIYADIAAAVQSKLNLISDPQARSQMVTPMLLTQILPTGLLGGFAALIISGAISCDDTYTHAWGTIFIQDVVMPLRRKPFAPRQHMFILRLAVIGVALFGFTFSMLFPLKDFILMFFALTGSIYLGGAGVVIIGGLYWKRGTTAAAWAAMSTGTVLAFGGILLERLWPVYIAQWLLSVIPSWEYLAQHQDKFPINGQWIYFIAMISATLCYILVSLLGPKEVCDMDKLLHRGKYRVMTDAVKDEDVCVKSKSLREKIGLTNEFSRFERIVFWSTMCWSLSWWGIFIIGTIINLFYKMPDSAWSWFWWLKIWLSVFLGIGTSAWLLSGGLRDAFRMFKELRQEHVDTSDDGFVHTAPDVAKPSD